MVDVQTGTVNQQDTLFSFDKIKPFTFNKYGILEDNMYQSKGQIELQFKVKSKDGLANLNLPNGYEFNLSLKSLNSVNLINFLSKEELTSFYGSFDGYRTKNTDFSGFCDVVTDGSSATSSLHFDADNEILLNYEYLHFVLTFNFDFSTAFDNFETEIYDPLLTNNSLIFDFTIGVN